MLTRSGTADIVVCISCAHADRSKALASLETVFDRSGVTPEDVLAAKKHTDAVLASSSEKVQLRSSSFTTFSAGPGVTRWLKHGCSAAC